MTLSYQKFPDALTVHRYIGNSEGLDVLGLEVYETFLFPKIGELVRVLQDRREERVLSVSISDALRKRDLQVTRDVN
jgi:hypothetical protein